MTWTANITIPAGETFDANVAASKIDNDPKYNDDVLAALEVVDALDGSDDVERLVTMTGYRSEMTTSITVSVTRRPNAA